LLFLASCCVALGCGGSPNYQVEGKATFAGQPIPAGTITFTPDAAKGNTGPVGYAIITNGQFSTSSGGGKGTAGGPTIVKIEGSDGVKIDDERPKGKALFPYYEMPVDLPKSNSTKDFDVPAAAAKMKPGGGKPTITP
jgi:hypothetical protein